MSLVILGCGLLATPSFADNTVDGANTGSDGTFCSNGEGFLPHPALESKISSNFGPRNCSGCSSNHPATDYGLDCGAKVLGAPSGCKKIGGDGTPNANGYGNVAQFDCGNGISIQYAHLQGTNAYNSQTNLVTTGTSGSSTACHLDYKVFLDNKPVDSQCITGSVNNFYKYGNSSTHHNKQCPFSGPVNLCNDAVQEELKKHAGSVLGGGGKGMSTPDGGTGGDHDDHDHNDGETGTPVTVNQGTLGKDGTGGVTPTNGPIEEPGKDPEEEEPEEPEPEKKYDPKASTPVCDNSTCITQDIIDNAKHLRVEDDKVKTHLKYLKAEGKCKEPIETGITVLSQRPGEIVEFPDAFCTNVGCTYKNDGGGKGKCE